MKYIEEDFCLKDVREKEITPTTEMCYLVVSHKVMKEAFEKKVMEDLGINRTGTNRYIGLKDKNICFVAVAQDKTMGVYCVINKYITKTNGQQVNLVTELKDYSLYNDGNGATRERTRTSKNEYTKGLGYDIRSVNIEAIIFTLRTGKIIGEATDTEVHHVKGVLDHRIEACELLTKKEHESRGNKSRKNGLTVNDTYKFAEVLRGLIQN